MFEMNKLSTRHLRMMNALEETLREIARSFQPYVSIFIRFYNLPPSPSTYTISLLQRIEIYPTTSSKLPFTDLKFPRSFISIVLSTRSRYLATNSTYNFYRARYRAHVEKDGGYTYTYNEHHVGQGRKGEGEEGRREYQVVGLCCQLCMVSA